MFTYLSETAMEWMFEIDHDTYDSLQTVYIPNLTNKDINIHSVKKTLREIGYEILHLAYWIRQR